MGCTNLDTQSIPTAPAANLSEFETWRLQGKIGVRTPQESKSAYLDWKNNGRNYQISLHGVFGLGRVKISKHDEFVELRANRETYKDENARDLIYQITGLDLPIEGLQYWIKGQTDPRSPVINQTLDEQDKHLLQLEQNGWQIEYSRYSPHKNLVLPRKLIAARDDLVLTLVIKKWE